MRRGFPAVVGSARDRRDDVARGAVLHGGAGRARRGRHQGRAARGRRRGTVVGPAVLERREHDVPGHERRQAVARARPAPRPRSPATARRRRGRLHPEPASGRRRGPRVRRGHRSRAQPAAGVRDDRRVRPRGAVEHAAGLRPARTGRGRHPQRDGGRGWSGRARRRVGDRPEHRRLGRARHPRGAARAGAIGRGPGDRRLAVRDRAGAPLLPAHRDISAAATSPAGTAPPFRPSLRTASTPLPTGR